MKKHAIYGPVSVSVSVSILQTVQSQTGTKVTCVRSVTETKLDRSEFIFRLTPCKCVKRNVWRSI